MGACAWQGKKEKKARAALHIDSIGSTGKKVERAEFVLFYTYLHTLPWRPHGGGVVAGRVAHGIWHMAYGLWLMTYDLQSWPTIKKAGQNGLP